MKKSLYLLFIFVITGIVLTACGGEDSNADNNNESNAEEGGGETVIKLAHTFTDNTNSNKEGALKFKELVEEKSNGTIKVENFASSQLGSEKELIEQTAMGTIDMTISGLSMIANYAPKAGYMALPYIVEGTDEAEKYNNLQELVKTDTYQEIIDQASENDLFIIPETVWWYGDRHITTDGFEVNEPEDLEGVKIRTPDSKASTLPFEVTGANVTTMDLPDVYMALQTGTIDAQENPIATIITSNFYEVQDTINLTGLMSQYFHPVFNKKFWDGLSEEQQNIITESVKEAAENQSVNQVKDNENLLKELEEKGMKVVHPNLDAFKEATADLYKEFDKDYKEEGFYQKIMDVQED